MPNELPSLLKLLRATKPETIEAHHFADYPPAVYDLVSHLGIPYDVHVHDYASSCPRVSLVGANDRYCGEPDLLDCELCRRSRPFLERGDYGRSIAPPLRFISFSRSARASCPPMIPAFRMPRHFDGLATTTVPHQDDAAISPTPKARTTARGRASVCVVGAIGVDKGYDVLLACARRRRSAHLDLEFHRRRRHHRRCPLSGDRADLHHRSFRTGRGRGPYCSAKCPVRLRRIHLS